jgi:thiol-disulfide isomerase/thioredoxin
MRLVAAALVGFLAGGGEKFEFELPRLGGGVVRSADFDRRPVVLILWGSWSPPSRDLARFLSEARAKGPLRGLPILGVHFETGADAEREKAARDFAAKFRLDFPLALGDATLRSRVPGFRGYPTLLLLDGRHKLLEVIQGFEDRPAFRSALESKLSSLLESVAD